MNDNSDRSRQEWALAAAMAADQTAVACQRLSETLSLEDCHAHLKSALERLRGLEASIRAEGIPRKSAPMVVSPLERLRHQVSLFHLLMRNLLVYRTELTGIAGGGAIVSGNLDSSAAAQYVLPEVQVPGATRVRLEA